MAEPTSMPLHVYIALLDALEAVEVLKELRKTHDLRDVEDNDVIATAYYCRENIDPRNPKDILEIVEFIRELKETHNVSSLSELETKLSRPC